MRGRILILFIVLNLLHLAIYAQPYGDEWIDYNKSYYKVTLSQDGVYRISYADLQSAGFPVNTIDPRRIQLYHMGVEQAIFVSGQGDAVFNTSDYIEFYGTHNDGATESRLFLDPTAQPHQLYSIYSDSSAYFLTYNLNTTNGKRMTSYSENNTGGLPALSSHIEENRLINKAVYAPGQGYSTDDLTRYTQFDYGEGWTSVAIQEGETADFSLSGILNANTSVSNPTIEILLLGRDDLPHNVSISVGPNSSTLRNIGTVQFDNYESYLFTSDILWSDISGGGSLVVRIAALGVSGGNDNMSTSYVRLFYPQNFDMTGLNSKLFNITSQASSKSYVEITGTPAQAQFYDVTDRDNVIRIGSNGIAGGHSAIINGTLSEREIYLNGTSFNTPVIRKSNFRSIDPTSHNYIIISHRSLMTPAGGLSNPVKSFAGYRSSMAGGEYDTLVVDIEMLYNQYNYGIVNPLAIYDFMRFLVDGGDPSYLFIIGKGLEPKVDFHRNLSGVINITQSGVSYQLKDLVPSAGTPGSDVAFTAGLNGTSYEPAVPVGRLPARNSQHVVNYLNKVIEMESTPFDDLWRKNILHLSGGITSSELLIFRSYMDGFEATATNDYLGGSVETLAKSSGTTIELINVADEVNAGLNLVTFYGHSAPNITDIDIGFVTDPLLGYSNSGRYPIFLVNGCNAGNFFASNVAFGEDWILAEDKGALGFIAHSSFGFSNNLKLYSNLFYETGFADSVFISKPIADIQKKVGEKFIDNAGISPNSITQVQQMVLLGDPAVNLFGPEYPDYAISDEDISVESFMEEPLTALADSFAIKIIIRNYGRTRSDSINIQVNRTLPNSTSITYDSLFAPVKYLDTLVFTIKKGEENGFGNNSFLIQLDYNFVIPELNETNNSASIESFIPLYGTLNLYPLNYSIVNSTTVQLKAQSTDILEGARDFLFEIDTTNNFNSPVLQTQTIIAKLIANWNVDLPSSIPLNDSTVYYWRTKFADTQSGESDEWVESSFVFINNGPEGWSQREEPQFKNDVLLGLEQNPATGDYEFLKTPRKVEITTYGGDHPAIPADLSVQIDDIEYIIDNGVRCRDNTVNLIAFDKNDARPYAAVPLVYSNTKTCGRQPQVINSFTFTELETGTSDIIEYVNNVNDGDSVVLFLFGNPQSQSWSANVLTKLEELGASTANISALQNGEPYILFGKKGSAAGSATEYKTSVSPETEQELSAVLNFTGIASSGVLTSTIIGPANQWNSIYSSIESGPNDQITFDVIGIKLNRTESTLLTDQSSFPIDISTIDAGVYPYLKLQYKIEDDVDLTPAQLKMWQVNYTPSAEGILIAESPNVDAVTLQEGAPLSRSFKFLNISNQNFLDSLVVKQEVFNRDTRQTKLNTFKIAAPVPNDTTQFTTSITTKGISGPNDYKLTINPRLEPEQYYDNNLIDLRNNLTINRDNINPLLDVLFDGRYILNGDIVSPTPNISIRLKDENPYIKVSDTTALNIFLKQECETCNFQRVAYSSPNIIWNPASENEDFKIDYRPNKLDDGVYTLRIDAQDESGNLSGEEPYIISFEVINESSITNFYPYPNPFSTSTRFVFTLTGSEIPNEIIIQIMTVTGKVVREITQDEIGPLFIGNNMTDYAWNGRDEFGDQLANGVYLYRVFVKQGGNTLKQRSTSADKAFKNGFGKLYILR